MPFNPAVISAMIIEVISIVINFFLLVRTNFDCLVEVILEYKIYILLEIRLPNLQSIFAFKLHCKHHTVQITANLCPLLSAQIGPSIHLSVSHGSSPIHVPSNLHPNEQVRQRNLTYQQIIRYFFRRQHLPVTFVSFSLTLRGGWELPVILPNPRLTL